jgi:hypothetical protein
VTTREWARIWFAVTALVVLAGIVITIPAAMDNEAGEFDTPLKRGLDGFVFFTIHSNIIVGIGGTFVALAAGAHWLDRRLTQARVLQYG